MQWLYSMFTLVYYIYDFVSFINRRINYLTQRALLNYLFTVKSMSPKERGAVPQWAMKPSAWAIVGSEAFGNVQVA